MAVGTIIQNISANSSTTHIESSFATDYQSYTTGGITFSYPTGLFTQSPLIQISIYPSSSHPTTETFTAEISGNSDISTTVMVYNISGGVVSEAPASSVTVYLFAVADLTGIDLY
jgi:hypothetical protein